MIMTVILIVCDQTIKPAVTGFFLPHIVCLEWGGNGHLIKRSQRQSNIFGLLPKRTYFLPALYSFHYSPKPKLRMMKEEKYGQISSNLAI